MVSYLSSLFDLTVCKHWNQMIPWTVFDLVGKIEREPRWNIPQSFAVILVLISWSWIRHRNSRKQSKFLHTIFSIPDMISNYTFGTLCYHFFGIICVFTLLCSHFFTFDRFIGRVPLCSCLVNSLWWMIVLCHVCLLFITTSVFLFWNSTILKI